MTRRNPSAVPADTSVEAWRVQMTAIRKTTPAERIRRWEEFNEALAAMESEALRRKFPDSTERERFLIRMRQRYGADLSSQVWPEISNLVAIVATDDLEADYSHEWASSLELGWLDCQRTTSEDAALN